MTNTAPAVTKVWFAGDADDDDVIGTVVAVETEGPEGEELVESMIWVQWPDIDMLDLLSWDDVIQVTS